MNGIQKQDHRGKTSNSCNTKHNLGLVWIDLFELIY